MAYVREAQAIRIQDPVKRRWVSAADRLLGLMIADRTADVRAGKGLAGPFSRILVARADGIGDLLLSLPALRSLRNALPEARLSLVVGAWAESVAREAALFDEIYSFGPGPEDYTRSIAAGRFGMLDMFRLLPRLRRAEFDVAVDVRGDIPIRLLLYSCGARCRVGFRLGLGDRLLTHAVPFALKAHEQRNYAALMQAVSGVPAAHPHQLRLLDLTFDPWSFRMTQGLRKDDVVVLVHPAARRPAKQWPEERYAQLVRRLLEGDGRIRVRLVGLPSEVRAYEKLMDREDARVRPLLLPLSLRVMAAWAASADLLIAPDGPWVHLSSLVGTPVVALFGPADSLQYGPRSPRSVSIRNIDETCADCNAVVCKHPEINCMARIGTDEVVAAARRILVL
ncbi:MAG: glycosyltransferase family 9 protein [Planctomycetes bacterium]|nr:glycosyltransferase family 9 protein [Planctomycetota bacterium]